MEYWAFLAECRACLAECRALLADTGLFGRSNDVAGHSFAI